jgi:hypothetical protein
MSNVRYWCLLGVLKIWVLGMASKKLILWNRSRLCRGNSKRWKWLAIPIRPTGSASMAFVDQLNAAKAAVPKVDWRSVRGATFVDGVVCDCGHAVPMLVQKPLSPLFCLAGAATDRIVP